MPICFDYIIAEWEYVYYSKQVYQGHKLIVFAHTKEKFNEELKKYEVYEEYYQRENKELEQVINTEQQQLRFNI